MVLALASNVFVVVLFWPELVERLQRVWGELPVQRDSYVMQRFQDLPRLGRPAPMRVIYLNREGALLRAGPDDARRNRSVLVKLAGLESASLPPFAGSPQTWRQAVECLSKKFADFNVEVVDQRPVEGRYLMVVVGGTPGALERRTNGAKASKTHSHSTGLAPFTGAPINDAVVLVFSRSLQERSNGICETAAMEIAHAYGLDHGYHCNDLMTYLPRCGAKTFLDRDIPCGESKPRACKSGGAVQNSHAWLESLLGRKATSKQHVPASSGK